MKRALLAAASIFASGCLEANLQLCGDNVCPAGAVCLANGTCATPDAVAACAGIADGTLCEAPGVDGACDDGVCVGSRCGDDRRTGREQCDGADVGPLTCGDFRFYEGSLACNASCLVDTNACSGSCGDGLVQADEGEICDNTKPPLGCFELGYDYGHIECTNKCVDTSRTECGTFRQTVVFSVPSGGISDMWRDGDLLVVANDSYGLTVIDRGIRTDHPGAFHTIAPRNDELVIAGTDSISILDAALQLRTEPIPGALQIRDLDVAPTGEVWVIDENCTIYRRDNAGAWDLPPAFPGTQCELLQIDATGAIYASDHNDVMLFDGSTWKLVESYFTVNALNVGRGGSVLAVTGLGAFELSGLTSTKTAANDYSLDAVALGDGYLSATLALARYLADRPVVFDIGVIDTPIHVRKMPDGSVLGWASTAYEIPRLFGNDPMSLDVKGITRGTKDGFVYWTDNTLYEFSDTGTTYFVNDTIRDVAIAGDGIYIASDSHLTIGSFAGGWTTEPFTQPQSIWGDRDGNIAVVQAGQVRYRAEGSSFVTLPTFGCGDSAQFVDGYTPTELYVTRSCPSGSEIDRWDGTQWTTVLSHAGYLGRPRHLDDDSLAYPSATRVAVGRGTTWADLPFAAGVVSGTSTTDLWLAGVDLTPLAPGGIAHWDGADLAPVRYPNNILGLYSIAADANTIVMSDSSTLRAVARFPVP